MPNNLPDNTVGSNAKAVDGIASNSVLAHESNASLNVENYNGGALAQTDEVESLIHHTHASIFTPPAPEKVATIMGITFSNSHRVAGKEEFISRMCKPILHSVNVYRVKDSNRDKFSHLLLNPGSKYYSYSGIKSEVRFTFAGAVAGLAMTKENFESVISNSILYADDWQVDGEIKDVGRSLPWFVTEEHVTMLNNELVIVKVFYDVPLIHAFKYGNFMDVVGAMGDDFTGVPILQNTTYIHDGQEDPELHTMDRFESIDGGGFRGLDRRIDITAQDTENGHPKHLSVHDAMIVLPSALSFLVNKVFPRLDKHFNKTMSIEALTTMTGSGKEFEDLSSMRISLAKLDVMSSRYAQLKELCKKITSSPFDTERRGTDVANFNEISALIKISFPNINW